MTEPGERSGAVVDVVPLDALPQPAAPKPELSTFIAAGDVVGACGAAAELIGAQQIPFTRLQELHAAGATVTFLPPDSLCSVVLGRRAAAAGTELPKGATTEEKLGGLFDRLFSTNQAVADGARKTLTGYSSELADAFALQAGRARAWPLSTPDKPLKYNDWRSVMVQPDGTIVALRVNDKVMKGQTKSSNDILRDTFTEFGTKTWDDVHDQTPYEGLIALSQIPSQRSARSKGLLTPAHAPSDWKAPEIPKYEGIGKVDASIGHRLASVTQARAAAHPGLIRTTHDWLRHHRTLPASLGETGWATNGNVINHMLRLSHVTASVGHLLAKKRGERGLVEALTNRIVASQIFELGVSKPAQAINPEDLEKLVTKDDLATAQRFALSIAFGAMRKGWFRTGGFDKAQVLGLQKALLQPSKPKAEITRSEVGDYNHIVEGYLGRSRSLQDARLSDVADAFLHPKGADSVKMVIRSR